VLRKWHINRLSMVIVIILAVFLSFYTVDAAAFEAAAFEAPASEPKPLSDLEMEEIYGGTPFLNIEFATMFDTADGGRGTTIASGYCKFGYDEPNVYQNAAGIINLNVTDNVGYPMINVALGNNIRQYVWNYINIELTNIHVENIAQYKCMADSLY